MLRKTVRKFLPWVGALILVGVLAGVGLVGWVVISHREALSLPTPDGPFQVGRTEYDWVDPARVDPLAAQGNAKRELLVWVWYPAAPGPDAAMAGYLPPEWVAARNQDKGLGQYFERNYAAIQTHAYEQPPAANAQGVYPVIIMQPGMGLVVADYTAFAEELASQGYVVVGINPTDTSDTVVFPDGRVALRTDLGTIPDNAGPAQVQADASRIGQVWAEDAVFVMDQLQGLDADGTSPFYQKLDLGHIGLFGHSFGGETALRVCETDSRCQAGADLDGTVFGDEVNASLSKPFMFMTEGGCAADCATMRQVLANSKAPAYYFSVAGTKHFNFSDMPLRLAPPARLLYRALGVIGSIAPARGTEIANAYLVAFFDAYLKGSQEALLQGPSGSFPEVTIEKKPSP